MRAQTMVRRKGGHVYRASSRCAFTEWVSASTRPFPRRRRIVFRAHGASVGRGGAPRTAGRAVRTRAPSRAQSAARLSGLDWRTSRTLDGLLREDAQRARLEIVKHLDGDLTIRALPGEVRGAGHPFEIRGRIKHDSLLAMNQEAACGTLVAGAGFEPATFGL